MYTCIYPCIYQSIHIHVRECLPVSIYLCTSIYQSTYMYLPTFACACTCTMYIYSVHVHVHVMGVEILSLLPDLLLSCSPYTLYKI